MANTTQIVVGSAALRDRTINLPNFENVNAGQEATARLVLDHTFHEVFADYYINGAKATLAQMKSTLEECKIAINGTEVSTFNVQDYLVHLQKEGYVFTDGIFPIVFRNSINARIPEAELLTSLGTVGLKQVTIVLKIADGVTAPQIKKLKARVGPNTKPTLMATFKTRYLNSLDAGDNDVNSIDMSESNGSLMGLDFVTDKIQELSLTYKDRALEQDKDRDQLAHELQNTAVGKVPQSGYTHLDFVANGSLSSSLVGQGGALELKLNMSSGGTVRVLDKRLKSVANFAQ